jgi:hypothetical protein
MSKNTIQIEIKQSCYISVATIMQALGPCDKNILQKYKKVVSLKQ